MRNKNAVFTVRTVSQAALMLELDGQISDGFWENCRPYDHWQIWCDAKVVVAEAGQKCGRNFWAVKTDYNLNAPALLKVVRKRMIGIVRLALRFNLEVAAAFEHAVDCETGLIEWNDRYRAIAEKHGLTEAAISGALLNTNTYDSKRLMRDLIELKATMKQFAQNVETPKFYDVAVAEMVKADVTVNDNIILSEN